MLSLSVEPTSGPGGAAVVVVRGELDLATAPSLEATVATLAAGPSGITIDVAGLTFCDPTGLSCLERVVHAARTRGAGCTVRGSSVALARLVDLVGSDLDLDGGG